MGIWLFAAGLVLGIALGAGWALWWSRAHSSAADAPLELTSALTRAASAEAQRDAAEARAEQLVSDRETLLHQFRSLSQETLDVHGERADAAASARLEQTGHLLAPVAESLRQVSERLTLAEKERVAQAERLRAEVEAVRRGNENLTRETQALVTALRRPQVRGTWGETQLRRVAEIAGMVERCDFDLQTSYRGEAGALRPDMRVHLGDGRQLFVDAKAPLTAFLDAAESDDPAVAAQAQARFAKHLRTHIDQLSSKQYWALTDLPSPEFVVLFLPGEGFLQAAVDAAPDLYDYAAQRGIVVATPTTLIAMLRTVAHVWRQQALADNAADVLRTGRELYDRLAVASGHLGQLGTELNSAVVAYNRAIGSLERRVFPTARRFQTLEVATSALDSPAAITESARPLIAPDWAEQETEEGSGETEPVGRTEGPGKA